MSRNVACILLKLFPTSVSRQFNARRWFKRAFLRYGTARRRESFQMILVAAAVLFFLPTEPHGGVPSDYKVQYSSQSESVQGKEYWQAIAKNNYRTPAGESMADLSRSLNAMLGSPDPEMRDEIAYQTFAQWIYQNHALSPADLRPLIAEWLGNLSKDIGSVGTDAVLRRSFSALVLSVVVARDNAAPFLEEEEFRGILRGAIAYEDAEKDLRGYDSDKGWLHSAAHAADLLKFLGRSRYVTPADQAAILGAISRKMRSADTVFTFGEDERMARTVLSIVARADFDGGGFHEWLANCKPVPPTAARPPIAHLRTYQNLKNMLAKLEVLLVSLPPDAPHAKEATLAVQDTLKGTF
jgi:hypothetical protein